MVRKFITVLALSVAVLAPPIAASAQIVEFSDRADVQLSAESNLRGRTPILLIILAIVAVAGVAAAAGGSDSAASP